MCSCELASLATPFNLFAGVNRPRLLLQQDTKKSSSKMNSLSVLFVLCSFALRACGQVLYADPLSTSCSTGGPLLGNSVYCCDGLCLDNTHIGSPGKCMAWLDLCSDVDTAPSCGPNQVLSYGDPANVQSGDGCCGACCCECQYMRNNWSWSCCDCPEGYIAVTGGRCGGSPSCVGCGGALQTLTGDEHTGFQCVETPPPPNPCDTAKTVDDAINKIGDWITKFGSLCPLDKLPAAISTLGQMLYVGAGASTANDNGFGTAVTSAFGGILVAAAVVAGGEAGLTVGVGLAEAYEAACGALGVIGPAAFVAGVAMDAVTRVECGSNTKRFILRSSSTTSPIVSNNPCSEFLSYFPDYPGNASFATSLDQECTQLYSDTTYQNITSNLQHLCHSYQDSGNSTLVIAFANLLSAIRNYEPYCATSTTSISTSPSATIIASVSESSSSVTTSGSASSSAKGTRTSPVSSSTPSSGSVYSSRYSGIISGPGSSSVSGTSTCAVSTSTSSSRSASSSTPSGKLTGPVSSSAIGTSTSSISTSNPGTSPSSLSSSSSCSGSVSSSTSSSTTSGSFYYSATGASPSSVPFSTPSGTTSGSVPPSVSSGTSAPASHPATSTGFDSTFTCSETSTGPMLPSVSSETTAASIPSSQSSGTSPTSVSSAPSGSRAATTSSSILSDTFSRALPSQTTPDSSSSASLASSSTGPSESTQTTGILSEGTSSSNAESATAHTTARSMASSGSQEPSTAAPTVPSRGTQSTGSPTIISGAGAASGESGSGGSNTRIVSSPSGSFTTAGGSVPFSAAAPLRSAANFGMINHITVTYMLVELFF